jgi:two-component system chemotaxis response regulator CheY
MKILVVDDEKDVKFLFEQRFRKEIRNNEIDFDFAYSGEEALLLLKTVTPESMIILSDINMPGMSGLELLTQVKNKFKDPPPWVMMITAYGDKENHSTAMRLGANGFLTKPLDFSVLKEKLKAIDQ